MATSVASPISSDQLRREQYRRERGFAAVLVTALTFFALLVHGYHPYAEDGGVYLPELKKLLDPALYPYGSEFVVHHLRYSLFAPAMAALVRESHLRIETTLLLVHLATFWMTLFAAWLLAARCYESRQARCGAVALMATWITLPVAGTSLMLMDPYVTARSLSTPCALLALAGALQFLLPQFEVEQENGPERWPGLLLCGTALAVAGVMHPLMAAYAFGAVLLLGVQLAVSRRVRVWGTAGLGFAALATAVGLVLSAAPESGAYKAIMLTRDYWFLSQWRWYEWIGLAAPLLILARIGTGQRSDDTQARTALARMTMIAGVTAILVAILFARPAMTVHAVARMQPLRIFQLVYVVMILELGAALAERVLVQRPMRWVLAFSLLAGVMIVVERRTFPASRHIELPAASGAAVRGNSWEQAFAWISQNTPKDGVFALDAEYITRPGEDAQGFRAIAERGVLPDFSKDGGVVTNKPELAASWLQGLAAQKGLDKETDGQRVATLKPLGVTWVVLDRVAATNFACVYSNDAVKVCRLP